MFYHEAGDIVYSNYNKFRDDNTVDVKTSKRPYLFLCDYEMGHSTGYLLKISSTVGEDEDEREFYPLVPKGQNKLRKKSYVDLRFVYDIDIRNGNIRGYVNDYVLEKIIKKLDRLQKAEQDSIYVEYSSVINRIM